MSEHPPPAEGDGPESHTGDPPSPPPPPPGDPSTVPFPPPPLPPMPHAGHGQPPPSPYPPPGYPPPYGQPPPYGPALGYGPASPSGQPPYGQPPLYGQPNPYGYSPPPGYSHYGYPPPYSTYGYPLIPVDRFGRPLAEWWQRLVAIIIDQLIIGIPQAVVVLVIVGSSSTNVFSTSPRAGLTLTGIGFAIVGVAYYALLNGSERGQTLGQIALGIAVRDEMNGGSIGPPRAAIRILVLEPGLAINWIPYVGVVAGLWTIVAGLSPLWDAHRQGFHDKVAHTNVIKVR